MTARTFGWATAGAAAGLLLPYAIAMTGAFGQLTSYETVLGYMLAGAVVGAIGGAVAARIHRGCRQAPAAARLSQEQAFAIARQAGAGVADIDSLEFAAVKEEQGETIWVFATGSRGSHFEVKVRDRDGHVVSCGKVGLR